MSTQEFRGIKVVYRQHRPGDHRACTPSNGVMCVFYQGPYKDDPCPAVDKEPGASCTSSNPLGPGIWLRAGDEQAQDSTIPSMVAP